jgi:predicted amidohydrolase YtcJ
MLFRATVLLLFFAANAAAQTSAADLIVINSDIRTMDKANSQAEAIAVADGRIIAVGTTKTIQAFVGKDTKVIDAQGRLVLPGFNDAHAHFMAIGNLFSSIDLSTAKTADDAVAKFKHYARFLPKGCWILGGKLDPSIALTRAQIDVVTPDNPVFVYHTDPKTAFVNVLAIKLAGLDETSGVLKGAAMQTVQRVVPANHVRNWPIIAESASNYAASLGVTSIQDTHSDDMAAVYTELYKQGRLKTRIYDCVSLSNWAKLAAIGIKAANGDAMVHNGCVKGFYDPEDEETASLATNIAGADGSGLQVLIHSIGQKANSVVLDAFEKAIAANGARDRRFRVEHAHDIRPADLPRFARSKIIPSMQPILFFADGTGTTDDYRKLLDTGSPLAFGADAPMKGFDPLLGIYAAVNAGGKRGITIEEAVYAYTVGAAFAEFQEKEKGSLDVGKLADFIVLSEDIFAIDKTKIRDTTVILTVVNGRIVYDNIK